MLRNIVAPFKLAQSSVTLIGTGSAGSVVGIRVDRMNRILNKLNGITKTLLITDRADKFWCSCHCLTVGPFQNVAAVRNSLAWAQGWTLNMLLRPSPAESITCTSGVKPIHSLPAVNSEHFVGAMKWTAI